MVVVANRRKYDKINKTVTSFFVVLQLVFVFFISVVSTFGSVEAADPTVVGINPVNQTVSAGDALSIAVRCSPQQAIKAFELKVSFDASLLQATRVIEGDIFDDFSTRFFNAGVIDNTAGTIVNIYNLIVGSGNVTAPGSLVLINFTARFLNGTSSVNLDDIRLTNESDYVTVTVSDGAVTVTGGITPSGYAITATAGTGGKIFPAGSISVNPGASQIFTITPDTNYQIRDVWVDGDSVGAVSTYSFTNVAMDHTISVSFVGDDTPPPVEPPIIPPPSSDENTPPSQPLKPTGLTNVPLGFSSNYSSTAYDADNDFIRIRFDWGDGSLSNWSAFVSSNTTLSMSHIWTTISNKSIRVIAQDLSSLNSSWSDPLIVIVIKPNANSGFLPQGMFTLPEAIVANQTVFFNTSALYDPDGTIVSYQWDFGDGTIGDGENPKHTYPFSGMYMVTLTVIDDTGLTLTMTKVVTVMSDSEAAAPLSSIIAFFQSNSSIIILVAVMLPFFFVFIVFRDRIEKFYVDRRIETSRRRLALGLEMSNTGEIDQIIDTLFGEGDLMRHAPSTETILNTRDVVVDRIERNPTYRPPIRSIEEIEKLVDRRIQAKIEEEIDKL